MEVQWQAGQSRSGPAALTGCPYEVPPDQVGHSAHLMAAVDIHDHAIDFQSNRAAAA